MIDKTHELPVIRQLKLLDLSRSSVYYLPQPTPDSDLRLMRRIDELHLECPFAGARMLRDLLKLESVEIGRKHVSTLMKTMGLEALYRRANTSRRNQAAPHLSLSFTPPHHRSSESGLGHGYDVHSDATGFCLFERRTRLGHPSSPGLASVQYAHRRPVCRCLALEEAILKYGPPEILNTDQGSQFTSSAFISVLEQNGIQISMDGKGCWRDNVFVERLWKSVKYEEIYLHGYDTVSVARQALGRYFDFYNRRRPHSTLDGMTPDTAYFNLSKPPLAAAA